jgi:hypothetical protein
MNDATCLATLFATHGSDKDVNGYSALYNALFLPLKYAPVKLLEIGVGTMVSGAPSSMKGYMDDSYRPGASLRAWRDFFPNGDVHGMDVQPDCQISEERLQTHLYDSTDADSVRAWIEARPGLEFDIIVDDGSHWDVHQLATLTNLFPLVKPGGFYVIEDVVPDSLVSREPRRVLDIVGDAGVFYAGLKNNLCVIHKVPLQCCRDHL